jgi:hydrogenase maturation protease
MVKKAPTILVYGYGNPGRMDDGLGIRLAEMIEGYCTEKGLDSVETDTNYQLNIEDAYALKDKELVIFADASMEMIEDYTFEPIEPSARTEFTMHSVSPAFILHLCDEIYHHQPKAYLLQIKGYEWELKETLTEKGKENLENAFHHLASFLENDIKNEENIKNQKN